MGDCVGSSSKTTNQQVKNDKVGDPGEMNKSIDKDLDIPQVLPEKSSIMRKNKIKKQERIK
jgi:hypothetical protein